MRPIYRNPFASRAVCRGGRHLLAAVAVLLPFAGRGFAAPPSNASLSGTYVFHFSNVKEVGWYATKSCHYTNITDTYSGGGQSVDEEVVTGEATFDGKGHVSFSFTDLHHFDQAASNATVSITCPAKPGEGVSTNNGHMVYEPASSGTYTGTYAVKSDGSATVTLTEVDGGLELNLASINSAGLSTTFLIQNPDGNYGYDLGIGVHK